jgi:hypothetical protein
MKKPQERIAVFSDTYPIGAVSITVLSRYLGWVRSE